ncbi:hypothetical protein HDF10_001788 [Edaphobacter lichenicola]|uniref:Uncharacterized protein n=1 Tax=Tunturiibacter lichenicola TaxID=2051959 RepID=A0A7W8J776_9BACT|nr:hypothetical protein [Edaphobacter lichenicola]
MKLEILDAEAETVRRIFEMSASGVTVPGIGGHGMPNTLLPRRLGS